MADPSRFTPDRYEFEQVGAGAYVCTNAYTGRYDYFGSLPPRDILTIQTVEHVTSMRFGQKPREFLLHDVPLEDIDAC